jgi:FixJ family two-component response regulator
MIGMPGNSGARCPDEGFELHGLRPGLKGGLPAMSKLPALSNATPIVFVVDDEISVRESLELLINNEGWHAETFGTADEFLAFPRPLVPSCLVLDLSLAGLDGLELQRRLATERSDIPIIFITGHGDVQATVQAMKARAVEFLTKSFSDAVILKAIRLALEQSGAALLEQADLQALRNRYAALSRREQEVMALVVRGLLNKQVDFELGISEITVKAHHGQAMRKMNAGSFAELITIAGTLTLSG